MTSTAAEIDRKLCVTAALVGAITRKELAAAFRRANPRTTFDVERAHKWIQGRAKPRERALYDDWALVLGLGKPAGWIADCPLADFIDTICADRAVDRAALLRRAEAFAGESRPAEHGGHRAEGGVAELIGEYVCYSKSWSPYFPDRVIRGALVIARGGGGSQAVYSEALPNGTLRASGRPRALRLTLHIELFAEEEGAAFPMSLFPATPPARVLGGLMCGASVLSADPQPCVSRITLFRLPDRTDEAAPPRALRSGAYLGKGASIARDLAELGGMVEDLETADRMIGAFLGSRATGPTDRAPITAYRDLVAFFDGEWARRAESAG